MDNFEILDNTYSVDGLIDDVYAAIRGIFDRKSLIFSVFINPWIPRLLSGDPVKLRFALITILKSVAEDAYTDGFVMLYIDGSQEKGRYRLVMSLTGTALGTHHDDDIRQSCETARDFCEEIGGSLKILGRGNAISSIDITITQNVADWENSGGLPDPTTKSVLLYDENQSRGSATRESFAALGLRYEWAQNQVELFDALMSKPFTHIFSPVRWIRDVVKFTLDFETPPTIIAIKSRPTDVVLGGLHAVMAPAHAVSIARAIEATEPVKPIEINLD